MPSISSGDDRAAALVAAVARGVRSELSGEFAALRADLEALRIGVNAVLAMRGDIEAIRADLEAMRGRHPGTPGRPPGSKTAGPRPADAPKLGRPKNAGPRLGNITNARLYFIDRAGTGEAYRDLLPAPDERGTFVANIVAPKKQGAFRDVDPYWWDVRQFRAAAEVIWPTLDPEQQTKIRGDFTAAAAASAADAADDARDADAAP